MSITNSVADIIPIIRGLIKDMQKTDGRDVFEYLGRDTFNIKRSFPNSTSFRVYINDVELDEDDFSYNADTNDILIDIQSSGVTLVLNDIVLITYSYYKKYSDTEIEGYIKASLTYFVEHKYFKIFEVDDDSYVISVNNTDPDIDELYFISIITAILIDPQNIDIDIDGNFKITKNRDKSDQDQIKEAFRQFKRFVGTISFEKLDDCGC